MTVLIENGHGVTSDQIIKEIQEMGLFPHEWETSTIPKGLGAYTQCLHLFVAKGELEIVVEGFPITASVGAYIHIPAKEVHELKTINEVHVYIGLKSEEISNLQRIQVADT